MNQAATDASPLPTSPRWRITLITCTPARFLAHVEAPDEIETAAKDFKIAAVAAGSARCATG